MFSQGGVSILSKTLTVLPSPVSDLSLHRKMPQSKKTLRAITYSLISHLLEEKRAFLRSFIWLLILEE